MYRLYWRYDSGAYAPNVSDDVELRITTEAIVAEGAAPAAPAAQ